MIPAKVFMQEVWRVEHTRKEEMPELQVEWSNLLHQIPYMYILNQSVTNDSLSKECFRDTSALLYRSAIRLQMEKAKSIIKSI